MGMAIDTHRPKPPDAPRQAVTKLAVTVTEEGAPFAWGAFMDLQISREQITTIARLLQRDDNFSAARLAGKGKPLSRAEFEHIRDKWVESGLVRWNNPRAHAQGAMLSPAGRALIKKLANTETDSSARARKRKG
jgi:hypothetical protein